MQGGCSPIGPRSTSPIDISSIGGSPHHSPNVNHGHPLPSIGSLGSVGSIPGGGGAGTNGYSGGSGGSPSYTTGDFMISAGIGGGGGGGGNTTQMDLGLSKEFQRFTMVSHYMADSK